MQSRDESLKAAISAVESEKGISGYRDTKQGNSKFEFTSRLQELFFRSPFLGSNLFLLFNSQSHILAMDTLSATTAGVDAAKGKTLEEMSDVVGVVSYMFQYS